MIATEIRINPKFETLLPPLSYDERKSLMMSLVEEGCREPIIVWNDWIVDGHNRYSICQEHEIDFDVREMEFENENDAIVWMIDNQGARRNLSDGWKFELSAKKKAILAEKGRKKCSEDGKRGRELQLGGLSQSDKGPDHESQPTAPHNTQKEIAKDLGWSTGKTAKADYVWKHGDDKLKEKVKSNEVSISAAYTDLSKKKKAEERQKKREELVETVRVIPPSDRFEIIRGDMRDTQLDRQFDFIITDPPYPKEFLPLWSDLARRAKEWLKPGGLLIAMSGQSYVNQILRMLDEHLDYYWIGSYLTPGQPTPLRQVDVNSIWKPLLIYKNGNRHGKTFSDVFKSDGNDKSLHHWGQSESGMFDIVSKICLPGQTILDPFCGAGTTGIAAIKHECLFCGIDIEEENANVSRSRLNETILKD